MRGLPKPSRARIIAGPGTETSDSIDMDVPEGTYILPADTTQAVAGRPRRDRGLNFARENPLDPASQKGRGLGLRSLMDIPISVSDGETEVPPETVAQIGAQVLDVVRNQTHDFSKGLNFAKAPARESQMIAGRGLPGFNGQPRLFFRDGGLVEDEERRRNSFSDNSAPGRTTGIMQTPEMAEGQRRQQEREGMADRITQTREGVGGAIRSGLSALETGGAAAESGLAAGQAHRDAVRNFVANTTFDDRLPGQARRDAARAEQQSRQNAQWVDGNPEQAQAAQQFGQDVAGRAVARGVQPPGGYPGVSTPLPVAGVGLPGYRASEQTASTTPAASPAAPQPAPEAIPAAGTPAGVAPPAAQPEQAQGASVGRGLPNNIIREGNSFSANGPIGAGYTINGQPAAVAGRGLPSAQNQQAVSSLMARTPELGQGAGRGLPGYSRPIADMERQQAQLERSNPNYLAVVRDSSRGGMQGFINSQLNARDAQRREERSDQHQQRIRDGQQQIMDARNTEQDRAWQAEDRDIARQQTDQDRQWMAEDREWLGEERSFTRADRERLASLQEQMADRSLPVPQRMAAQQAYTEMVSPGSAARTQAERESARQRTIADLYRQYSGMTIPPQDQNGNPIPFDVWARPALQAMEQGGQREQAAAPQSSDGMTLVGTSSGNNVYRDAMGNLFVDE